MATAVSSARRPLPLRTPLSAHDVKEIVKKKVAVLLHFLVQHGVRQRTKTAASERDTPAMVIAVFSRFETTAQKLLDRGVRVNAGYAYRRTSALYAACGYARLEVVQWLVEHGAIVDDPDDQGVTPLMVAAARGRVRIVEYLVSVGADVTKMTRWGTTVAFQCAANGGRGVLAFLLTLEAYQRPRDKKKKNRNPGVRENLLQAAFRGDQLDIVWHLLEDHMDKLDKHHLSACLADAIRRREVELVELLVANGADVDTVDENGCTPAFHAVEYNSIEILEILLQNGADTRRRAAPRWRSVLHAMLGFGRFRMLELVDRVRGTDEFCSVLLTTFMPLYVAISHGYAEVLLLLLKLAPWIDVNCDFDESSPLTIAAGNGDLSIVRILVNHGANVNAKVYGTTALIKAARSGSLDVVCFLCEHGADVNMSVVNRDDPTALFAAVRSGHIHVVEYLLEECQASMGGDGGASMLRIAALHGHVDVVRVLLAHGASVPRSSNVLCKVILRGHMEIMKLLLRRGGVDVNGACRLNAKSAWAWGDDTDCIVMQKVVMTPLLVAAACGNLGMVQYLCEHHDADVEIVTDANESALFLAALKGHSNVVKYLITKQHVNIECSNIQGFTPATAARCQGHDELLELLVAHGASLPLLEDENEILWDAFEVNRQYDDTDFVLGDVGQVR
ncbi:Tkl protein kinase, partial [Globisporangium splendens]